MNKKDFFDENLLINNEAGIELYKNHAKGRPILDYHCHLNPAEIYNDTSFDNLGSLWLGGDHYKWRAMRQNGVDEELITGKADYKDKFFAFADTLNLMPGNPLYYWSHMELKALFGINTPLNAETAEKIWSESCEKLKGMTARKLIDAFDVRLICTTDDPADDLKYHNLLKNDKTMKAKVLPTFRPDIICSGLERNDILSYIKKLGETENTEITSFETLLEVLEKRLIYFKNSGCVIADHGVGTLPSVRGSFEDAKEAFESVLAGEKLSADKCEKYLDYMLRFFIVRYYKMGFTMQLHMSPLRNINSRLFKITGPDSGIDTVGDPVSAKDLAGLLDAANSEAGLPRMIFYSLNSTSNDMLSAMTGSFSGEYPGKMQLGSAWWFSDHVEGIRLQLKSFASSGLLGRFVGMLTDSRSFTSYVRFDFFRRILCDVVGEWVEKGEFNPKAGHIIENISFRNASEIFGIKL